MYLVYKHTSPSGKSYIGITNNYQRRCSRHRDPSSGCRAFSAAIKKYGWDNFTHEILITNITIEEANIQEQLLIISYNTLAPNGYNLTTGGYAKILSEETKAKLSIANKGKVMSEEAKRHLSEMKMGVLKGRPITEETKRSRMGRVPSDEARKSMSDAAKRRHQSTVSKTAKNYIVTSPSGEVYDIINLAQFCKKNNLRDNSMSMVAKGKYKHHRGWKCEYKLQG